MNYWWVNQNGTYRFEVPGNYLWSPKTKKNEGRNQFYLNMLEVRPGDVVFSFCDTYIKAIGVAKKKAVDSPKPEFGKSGDPWNDHGWLVHVDFTELTNQIRPKDSIELLKPYLPPKYSPLSNEGNGYQAVYLTEVPDAMASVLIRLIGNEYPTIVKSNPVRVVEEELEGLGDQEEDAIRGRIQTGPTSTRQLIDARRGHGIFKTNVLRNEKQCRVTGISDISHLRASHIKPWVKSDDKEKLHGANGLMLAPHIDHLFDRGYLSFGDDGELLVSPKLKSEIMSTWGIPMKKNVGKFKPSQAMFLAYHRRYVFKK
ncbi:HNH endonuclease [Janthinobacterium sp. BJB303]|nr:HNH endonuclease [Janthinobacterium sp. BJB303]